MPKELQTIKVWRSTLRALKLLAAIRGQSMVRVMDELVGMALKAEKAKADKPKED